MRAIRSHRSMLNGWKRWSSILLIEIQQKIHAYDKQLTQWLTTLSSQFDSRSWKDYSETEFFRAAFAISAYSIRTIINRSALCRIECQISHQFDAFVESSHHAAQRCVHAARAMLQFLLGEPKGTNIRQSSIWWVRISNSRPSLSLYLEFLCKW